MRCAYLLENKQKQILKDLIKIFNKNNKIKSMQKYNLILNEILYSQVGEDIHKYLSRKKNLIQSKKLR